MVHVNDRSITCRMQERGYVVTPGKIQVVDHGFDCSRRQPRTKVAIDVAGLVGAADRVVTLPHHLADEVLLRQEIPLLASSTEAVAADHAECVRVALDFLG